MKRLVNTARLENATYEEIVNHLEQDHELNGFEEGDDIPVPLLSTVPKAPRPGNGLLSSGIDPRITGNYCKEPGHTKDECQNLERNRNLNATTASLPKKSAQSARLVTKRTKRPNGVGKRPEFTSSLKNLKLEDTTTDDTSTSQKVAKINKQRQFSRTHKRFATTLKN